MMEWHPRSSEQHFCVWGLPASPTLTHALLSWVLFLCCTMIYSLNSTAQGWKDIGSSQIVFLLLFHS